MVTEKGNLAIGIEYKGEYHTVFEMRPLKVREIIEIQESDADKRSETYQSLQVFAAMLVKIGTIPKSEITPDLLMDLYETDIKELADARMKLEKRLKGLSGKKRK